MSEEILDFSDLAQDTKFKFKDTVYYVPPLTGVQAKEVYAQLSSLEKKKTEAEVAEGEEKEENDSMEGYIKFQNSFISSVVKRENGESVTPEEVEKDWPMKVCKKVVELISSCISGEVGATKEEKK